MKGGKRGRKRGRDAKYTMGIDLAAGGDLTAVVATHEDGVFTIEQVIRADRERSDFEEILGILGEQLRRDQEEIAERILRGSFTYVYQPGEEPVVIEGEFVPVETRGDHLLDAGGSEP